jgi:hypothetical protein
MRKPKEPKKPGPAPHGVYINEKALKHFRPAKKQCFHPEKWRDSSLCELCRYREALEKIMFLSIGPGFAPTTRCGVAMNKAIDIATEALFPSEEGQAK